MGFVIIETIIFLKIISIGFYWKNVTKGDKITPDNIRSIRPGHGLHPKHYHNILGKQFSADFEKGVPMSFDKIL